MYVEMEGFSFISLGWRYQNGKTQAPYEIVNGKFYTNFRVSREIAKFIYAAVIQRVGELEGRVIEFDDKMWRAPIIGQSSFQKTLPTYWAEKYGPKNDPRGIEMDWTEYQEYVKSIGGDDVPEIDPEAYPEEDGTPVVFPTTSKAEPKVFTPTPVQEPENKEDPYFKYKAKSDAIIAEREREKKKTLQ